MVLNTITNTNQFFYKNIYFFITTILLLLNLTQSKYKGKLQFKEGKEFTILQFTDLHYGEDGMNDVNSTILQQKLINFTSPDLVIITGDSVSGYAWDNLNSTFYKDCWHAWTKPMRKMKVPYAYTLGNHDDQADFTRKQIIDLDRTHNYSLTQYNPNITGATNYYLPIYSSQNETDVSTLLWMFDTNDETCEGMTDSWGCFEVDQVEWYKNETKKIKQFYNKHINGLAFFHIPIPEYIDMYNWRKTYNFRNEGIACPRKNTQLFKAILESKNVNATFCGHDHDNDHGGFFYGIELVYGRKTGYGGYGPSYFQRGARVIKLREIVKSDGEVDYVYRHYVVQEDLTVVENTESVWRGSYERLPRCHKT
jgi:predicted MPP superfamily phosphohydrolase